MDTGMRRWGVADHERHSSKLIGSIKELQYNKAIEFLMGLVSLEPNRV
jgi:hypothetical protein